MAENRIIQEAINIRGNIYDIIQALVAEHGIEMILSVLEDVCFIHATSLRIHDKDIGKAELWDNLGQQIASIKIEQ